MNSNLCRSLILAVFLPSLFAPTICLFTLIYCSFLSPCNSKLLHYNMQMYGQLCLWQIKAGSHVCIGNWWWGLVWFAIGSFRYDLKLVFLQIAVYLLIPRPWCRSGDSRMLGSLFSCCLINEAPLKLRTAHGNTQKVKNACLPSGFLENLLFLS